MGMTRGFEAVLSVIENDSAEDMKNLFAKIGMALITSIGGAAGIIFGTWFIGGGKGLTGRTSSMPKHWWSSCRTDREPFRTVEKPKQVTRP